MSGCEILWRVWDEEFVVYNTGSGDTHLLDRFTGEVLLTLSESPATLTQLTERVCLKMDLDPQPEVSSYLHTLLPRLCELDLIEIAPH